VSDVDDVLECVFNGTNRVLYQDFESWVRGSRRFRAFAASYCSKIRAKLRNVRGEEGIKDLRAEFETAALLLRDQQFALEYEKYVASGARGPDFTVTYKTHTPFNVEVRHVRSPSPVEGDAEAHFLKLIAAVCDKVAQMPPSMVNLLWLVPEHQTSEPELVLVAGTLRHLAERRTDAFFAHYGYESSTDFLRQYSRLSGIVLRQSSGNTLWLNPVARHKVPPGIAGAIERLER
jgi:hypothetical protein